MWKDVRRQIEYTFHVKLRRRYFTWNRIKLKISRWAVYAGLALFFYLCYVKSVYDEELSETEELERESRLKKRDLRHIKDPLRKLRQDVRNVEFTGIYNNRKLRDFLLSRHGQPIRTLVISNERSGSNFLAEILNTHPGTFYMHEPINLLLMGKKDAFSCSVSNMTNATPILRRFLNCDFGCLAPPNETRTTVMTHPELWLYLKNHQARSTCEQHFSLCSERYHLERICKKFPIQAMKFIRLPLENAEELLADSSLNIRIIYLVRDPRGTMRSRYQLKKHMGLDWIPPVLCSRLEKDHQSAVKFREKYPDKFMVVRYEELAMDVWSGTKKIFEFLNLKFPTELTQYLNDHTVVNIGGPMSTIRESKSRPFKWVGDARNNFTHVAEVQKPCGKAIRLWEYKYLNHSKELKIGPFKPVQKSQWSLY